MNVANLQLEGLIMAIASLNQMLVSKGVASIDDIETALHKAEAGLTGEERLFEDLRPAHRDAVCFPLRVLRMANHAQSQADVPGFTELARMVGETKSGYGDQQ